MKTNKAVGLDKIGARLLKDSVDVITPSLTNLQIIVNFNKILATLIFNGLMHSIYIKYPGGGLPHETDGDARRLA